MNFFRSLLPGNPPPKIAKQGELMVLRERILHTVLLLLAGIGSAAFIIFLFQAVSAQQTNIIVVFSGLFTTLIVLAIWRSLPYDLRGGMLLLIFLAAGIWTLSNDGLSGNARMFLFTFVTLTAVLFGYRLNLASVLVSVLVMVVVWLTMTNGIIPIPPLGHYGDSSSTPDWLLAIALFVFMVFGSTSSITTIVRGMEATMKNQAALATELEKERSELESRVNEHTYDLQRRLLQIRTAVEISRSISTELDPRALLQEVVDLLRERMDLYYAGVFLVDEASNFAVLRTGTGEAGRAMIAAGHRLQVGGSSMIGWTIANRQARIALDVGADAIRFSNPHLPLTRSELAIPIQTSTRVLGALTIQSTKPSAFDDDDILVFQGVTDSLAIALENARLFQENQRDLEEIRSLNSQYLEKAWSEVGEVYGKLQFTYENPQFNLVDNVRTDEVGQLTVPILLRDQEIGTITLETSSPSLNAEEKEYVDAVVTQTALALESARLLDETQRKAAQEEKINQLSAEFTQASSIDQILRIALEELGQMPAVTDVSVHILPGLTTEVMKVDSMPGHGKNGNGNHRSNTTGKNGKEHTA